MAATIKFKLCKNITTENQKREYINVARLNSPDVKTKFTIELRNHFKVLEDNEELQLDNIQNILERIRETYVKTSKEVLGLRKSNSKDRLSEDTWKAREERKSIYQKMLNTKSGTIHNSLKADYREKDKEVKK